MKHENLSYTKQGMVITQDDVKKHYRDMDGGIGEHIEKDAEKTDAGYEKAKENRTKARIDAARQSMKNRTQKAFEERIVSDSANGEATAAQIEIQKDEEKYNKRKKIMEEEIERRKAMRMQKSRA